MTKLLNDGIDVEPWVSSPAARRAGKGIHHLHSLMDSLPLRFAPAGNDNNMVWMAAE
jgi:hypothetical protein